MFLLCLFYTIKRVPAFKLLIIPFLVVCLIDFLLFLFYLQLIIVNYLYLIEFLLCSYFLDLLNY